MLEWSEPLLVPLLEQTGLGVLLVEMLGALAHVNTAAGFACSASGIEVPDFAKCGPAV